MLEEISRYLSLVNKLCDLWRWKQSGFKDFFFKMDRVKRIWYLSPMQAAKIQASLRIRAVSPEPSLLAHTSSESKGTVRQKVRSLAPLNGWACAVKICHDGLLEDTNSLDGAQNMIVFVCLFDLSSYSPVNILRSCLVRSVILSTVFLGRLSKRLPSNVYSWKLPQNTWQFTIIRKNFIFASIHELDPSPI